MVQEDRPMEAYDALTPKVKTSDKILYLQERARVSELDKKIEWSIEDYENAAKVIEENQMKASISASSLGSIGASLLTNDNAIPYTGYGYEKVFLHSFQTLNYLELGKLEGEMVEVRRANNEQTYALQQNEKEVAKVQDEAKKHQVSSATNEAGFSKAYADMAFAASGVKNSFQNAFTFYLSGVLYEMDNDPNNALISYKKAVEIYPENKYAVDSVFRLAESMRFEDDLEHYGKLFGKVNPQKPRAGDGRLVVVYEDGFVPMKEQLMIPFFWNGISYTIAMPYYSSDITPAYSMSLLHNNRLLGKTENICTVRALAVKALMEEYSGIFIRQVIRIVVKDQIQRQAQKQDSVLGLVTAIGALLSERADRRSWLTLPDNVQVGDYFIPAGEYTFNLDHPSAQGVSPVVAVQDGKTTILRVTRTGGRFYSRVIGAI